MTKSASDIAFSILATYWICLNFEETIRFLTVLSVSNTVIFFDKLFFWTPLAIEEPIRPKPIIKIFENIKIY